MVEEKVARTRRTNERIVIDVEEAPEDDDVQASHFSYTLPLESLVHSSDVD